MKTVLLIGVGRFGRHIAMKLSDLGHQIMAWIESQYPSARRFRLEVTEVNQRAVALYAKSGYQYLHYDQMVLDKVSGGLDEHI